MYENKKLPKLSLILNDVKLEGGNRKYGYGYGYGYGYRYGDGDGDGEAAGAVPAEEKASA